MAKRMIDTNLWNNEDIIEYFTSEDKYFWLYLLTSPHNNICGVFKNSPTLIARDMGLHKDTIVNLLYRFENIHKLVYCDKETNEILILNWYKWNWTKSQDLMKTINKQMNEIKSNKIIELLKERAFIIHRDNTVITPSIDHTNTNSNTNNINNNIVTNEEINNYFDKIYSIYPRKVSKVQAKATFSKKLKGMDKNTAHKKAVSIYRLIEKQIEVWQSENNGEGRKLEHIPYMSSWLSANVEDSPNIRRNK
jgi:hypothetical protein